VKAPTTEGDLYVVDLPYAYFGIIVVGDKVLWAAPIGKWMVGRSVAAVRAWLSHRRGRLTPSEES